MTINVCRFWSGCAAILGLALASVAHAQTPAGSKPQESAEELAKKLANPVAHLISVPFQFNFDQRIGPERKGERYTTNIQPVVPISLTADLGLISRTILPVTSQNDIAAGSGQQFGIGDITQSFFLSPKKGGAGGLIWGAGPAILVPTGSDDLLSARKWGLGPTAVGLVQHGPWTYGILANHIWSVTGDEDRADINNTFLQPFVSYTTKDAYTFGLNTEATYDWTHGDWSVPINVTIGKLFKFGSQPVSLTGGVRYWVESPDTAPHGWGARLVLTFLFPE